MSEELVEVSAEQIALSLKNINECLLALGQAPTRGGKVCTELPTPAKTYYKPEGYEDYLNLKE